MWARPDALDQVDYALETGVRILEYFEDYFGIPFPLLKQGTRQVAGADSLGSVLRVYSP